MNADEITIDNRMLGADARRQPIDDAVRAALAGIPGPWRVVVSEVTRFSPPWWSVTAEGNGKVVEMSLRAWEQRAETLRDRLREALRERALAG